MQTLTETHIGKELVLIPSVTLTSGVTVTNIPIVYETSELNWKHKPVVLLIHALTGSSHVKSTPLDSTAGWWEAFIGDESASVDLHSFSVVSPNLPGSCYGSWLPDHELSIADITLILEAFLHVLGLTEIHAVIGGSLGGMIALQLTKNQTISIKKTIAISCGARQSAWAKSWGHLGLTALNTSEDTEKGLALARQIAMVSYRSHSDFELKSGDIQSYLNYQGKKFTNRFDVWSYELLVKAMDTHNMGSDYNEVNTQVLVIGNTLDVLYPTADQREVVRLFSNSHYFEFTSNKGHDAFLTDHVILNPVINNFLKRS